MVPILNGIYSLEENMPVIQMVFECRIGFKWIKFGRFCHLKTGQKCIRKFECLNSCYLVGAMTLTSRYSDDVKLLNKL